MTSITERQQSYIEDIAYRYADDFTRAGRDASDWMWAYTEATTGRYTSVIAVDAPATSIEALKAAGLTLPEIQAQRATEEPAWIAAAKEAWAAEEALIAKQLTRVADLTKDEASQLITMMKAH